MLVLSRKENQRVVFPSLGIGVSRHERQRQSGASGF